MDDRIKRALALIEEWDGNRNPSGRNDIDTLYALKEILEEEPSGNRGSRRETEPEPGM